MKDLKPFNIPFVGLKEGLHLFEFEIDNTFFKYFGFDEFNKTSIIINLEFTKKSTLFELSFKANGTVNILCDISATWFDQEVNTQLPLIVKFGAEYNDEHEDILILPPEAYQLNVAQFIYEMIVLSIPAKRIHPKVLDGTLETIAMKKLKELSIKQEDTAEHSDPRWDKLKNILTAKKT